MQTLKNNGACVVVPTYPCLSMAETRKILTASNFMFAASVFEGHVLDSPDEENRLVKKILRVCVSVS